VAEPIAKTYFTLDSCLWHRSRKRWYLAHINTVSRHADSLYFWSMAGMCRWRTIPKMQSRESILILYSRMRSSNKEKYSNSKKRGYERRYSWLKSTRAGCPLNSSTGAPYPQQMPHANAHTNKTGTNFYTETLVWALPQMQNPRKRRGEIGMRAASVVILWWWQPYTSIYNFLKQATRARWIISYLKQ